MQPKSKEFLALQAEWYQKLKDEGFEDIEQEDGLLKFWTTTLYRKHFHDVVSDAKEEYYRLAGQFLHEHKFSNKQEKLVWEHHASGKSIREIILVLRASGYKTYKNKAFSTIKRLSESMVQKCR